VRGGADTCRLKAKDPSVGKPPGGPTHYNRGTVRYGNIGLPSRGQKRNPLEELEESFHLKGRVISV